MPPRRPASSQNSQVDADILLPPKVLPLMSTEGIYRHLGTLAGLVQHTLLFPYLLLFAEYVD